MNILILGGTSYVGPSIARLLKEAGHSVTLFSRANQTSARAKEFEHFKGDVKDPAKLHEVAKLKKWDTVIHQVAFEAQDVERALEVFSKVKRFVLTSTISVYRYVCAAKNLQPFFESAIDYGTVPVDEDLSDRHWNYARGKLEAEKVLVSQKKIPYTILRHSFIFGPNDSFQRSLWYAQKLLKKHPILLSDQGLNTIRLVYEFDAARAMQLATLSAKGENEIFNVCQDEIISLKEYIDETAGLLRVEPDYHSIPSELIPESWRGPLCYSRNWIMSNEKIKKIGFIPTPFRRALSETLNNLPMNLGSGSSEDLGMQRNLITEWNHLRKQIDHK